MTPNTATTLGVASTPDPDALAAPENASACADARIVIVDDEPLNSTQLETFLGTLGYKHVVILAPGQATPDSLRDERPDLVMLELTLLEPGAFDILAWIKTDRSLRDVPVIVTTSQDDRPSRLRALKLGAADFLVKPIDPAELGLRLRNTLVSKIHYDQLATTDGLTGLPNRKSSLYRLDWALKHARRYNTIGAVLQVGLDRCKQVHDAFGPAIGDELLREVGLRLEACVRGIDSMTRDVTLETAAQVARGDGDEFTVLLPALARADYASVVAQRIVESMADPFTVVGYEHFLTCRVGIAVFPLDSLDKDTVLKQATLAMRHGRVAGEAAGSGFRLYSQELNGRATNRLALERELHHALDRDELVLHYQPRIDMASGRICGAEALVRWRHPQRGLLGPGAFIGVAEETGLIVPLGDWVLREALRQAGVWRRSGSVPLQIAVNVSSFQLRRPGLDHTVRSALANAGLDGTSLCLELTESAIMDTGANVTDTLHAIRQMGVCMAIDDFGTGYSSLSYLRRFPLDELKIDRSFVVECQTGDNSATVITKAIIAMAHGLGLRVVAEGVETPQQLAFVRANACDQYQGYLFSPPASAKEFEALLARRSARAAFTPAALLNPPGHERVSGFRRFADTAVEAHL